MNVLAHILFDIGGHCDGRNESSEGAAVATVLQVHGIVRYHRTVADLLTRESGTLTPLHH